MAHNGKDDFSKDQFYTDAVLSTAKSTQPLMNEPLHRRYAVNWSDNCETDGQYAWSETKRYTRKVKARWDSTIWFYICAAECFAHMNTLLQSTFENLSLLSSCILASCARLRLHICNMSEVQMSGFAPNSWRQIIFSENGEPVLWPKYLVLTYSQCETTRFWRTSRCVQVAACKGNIQLVGLAFQYLPLGWHAEDLSDQKLFDCELLCHLSLNTLLSAILTSLCLTGHSWNS